MKEKLLVEYAQMPKYGIITVLPFSKYANPIFAQKKNPMEDYVYLWIWWKSTA